MRARLHGSRRSGKVCSRHRSGSSVRFVLPSSRDRRGFRLSFSPHSFADRQASSTAAKKALLERFKARPRADDPVMIQRRAEREAVATARSAREAVKAAERAAEARLAAAERERIAELAHLEELTRQAAAQAELARIEAERPRKVLLEAVQYMQARTAGKRR